MFKIVTVCGNGIGSSLMLKMKVEEIAKTHNVDASVESIDAGAARGKEADLFVTAHEFSDSLPEGANVAYIRSYVNKTKIEEDIKTALLSLR